MIIGNLDFEGPMVSSAVVDSQCGLYTILKLEETGYKVIEVGDSDNLNVTLHDLQNIEKWKDQTKGYFIAVYYSPHLRKNSRQKLKNSILNKYLK